MSLDERGLKILRLIVDNPAISGSELEKELGLSRKQVSYSLKKINFYLLENGYDEIARMKTGKFIIPREVINAYKTDTYAYDEYKYVFVEQERLNLIVLILLQHKEELSINHFTSILKISKNTVLNDMKKLQSSLLDQFDLKIWYDRQKGYCIVGKEYEKRILMIKVIRNILPMLTGESLMMSILEIKEDHINELRKDVEEVERRLKLRYTDERIREIPYILYFVLLRIKAKKYLDVLPEDYQHIIGTSEYGTILKVFDKYDIQNAMEKIYLVSQFQISSVNFTGENSREFELELQQGAEAVLRNFENLICIKFQDHESLLDALIQHCRPAIYRIRYSYHIESNILNLILPQHSYLFEITKHAMAPFEEMIGKVFPDEELAYITILFGGWLTKEGSLDVLEKKRKAIVVCTNGVSISNFLFLKLKEAFPELDFLCALSSRQFYDFDQEYDVIFSTVHLETTNPQFLVKPIMDDFDMQNMRRKVFSELLNKHIYEINSSSLLGVIDKFVDIKDKKGLTLALKSFLGEIKEDNESNIIETQNDDAIALEQVLSADRICISNENLDWKSAITKAAQPLLDSKCIEFSYLKSMINAVEHDNVIWTIADGLILAHAGVDEGVNHLGISLLKLNNKIRFNDFMEASVIVVMATPNREIHLKALYTLIDITENEADFKQLKCADTKEQILEIISKERN